MNARPQYSTQTQANSSDANPGAPSRIYPPRVVVPASRVTTGNYASPVYRPVYSQPTCNAMNRLDSVTDEKPDLKRVGYDSSQRIYRTADKSRGLRHFSTKVCEKVKEKGRTNYNEVADELVNEYFESLTTPPQSSEKQQYDMKNIRRRVYDALNVLMAMNIIEKEKKEIRWVGLPTSSTQECRRLEDEKIQRQESIQRKTEQLQEMVIQLVAYKTLVQRNRENERKEGRGPPESMIFLPFIVVNTSKDTVVDCSIASDKTEFIFRFDQPFEIHDDIEILKRLGLAHGLDKSNVPDEYKEHIRNCLPPALRGYADQIIEGTLVESFNVEPQPPAPKIHVLQPERKVPVVRALAPVQARPVYNRHNIQAKPVRPSNAPIYRQPIRAHGQPYAIPPSGVHRQFGIPPNGKPVVVRPTASRVTYLPANGSGTMARPQNEQEMHYEDIAYDDYQNYEQ